MRPQRIRALVVAATVAVLLIVVTAYMWVGPGAALTQNRASAASLYDESTVAAIYTNTAPAVVEVLTQTAGGLSGAFREEGQGSGFLIDGQGYILTNNHVVDGSTNVQVHLSNGANLTAQVAGTDPADDLALLKVDSSAVSDITPVPLGNSSTMQPGNMAIALGSPYGLNGTITVGVISGLNRTIIGNVGRPMIGLLQTDAALNPGNSGGPLLNSQGQAVGINTAIQTSYSGATGIGFAVPINTAVGVLSKLEAGGQVSRPWLGISGTAITPDLAQKLGLPVSAGVYIVSVLPDSPASKAGLQGSGTAADGTAVSGGDIITAVDNRAANSVEDLIAYFNTKNVGDTVTLTVLRNGSTMSVPVTLAAWPANLQSAQQPHVLPQPQIVPQPQPTPQPLPRWPWQWRFPMPHGWGN